MTDKGIAMETVAVLPIKMQAGQTDADFEATHEPCTENICDCIEHICGRTACGVVDDATLCDGKRDDTTDAVSEAREMIAAFEIISNGRTRYAGQPERADERYDRNRRALVAHIERLEAENAALRKAIEAVRALLAPYDGGEPWTTTSADCDHESCERLAAVQALLEGKG
jgi:hypothetical protein